MSSKYYIIQKHKRYKSSLSQKAVIAQVPRLWRGTKTKRSLKLNLQRDFSILCTNTTDLIIFGKAFFIEIIITFKRTDLEVS